MADPTILDVADDIIQFRRHGLRPKTTRPCRPIAGEDEAERIQELVALSIGEAVVGWKLGATDERGRQRLKLSRPFIGRVFRSRLYHHPALLGRMFLPHCIPEAELAFRIDRDLTARPAPYTADDILAATASCHAAFEIVDFTWSDRAVLSGIDYLADNGGCGGMVVGPPQPLTELGGSSVSLEIGGAIVASNTIDKSLRELAKSVAWLANHLLGRNECLRAGQYVATGNWTGMNRMVSGQRAVARFERLGSIVAEMP